MDIIGTQYIKKGQYGDFDWMIKQKEYSDSLFIFNDDEERHKSCAQGKGNAIIRKYNIYSNFKKPRSAGIPTGTVKRGGYNKLTSHIKFEIDQALKEIKEIIEKYKYKKVFYSADKEGKLGTSIFRVGNDVIEYITLEIQNLKN